MFLCCLYLLAWITSLVYVEGLPEQPTLKGLISHPIEGGENKLLWQQQHQTIQDTEIRLMVLGKGWVSKGLATQAWGPEGRFPARKNVLVLTATCSPAAVGGGEIKQEGLLSSSQPVYSIDKR